MSTIIKGILTAIAAIVMAVAGMVLAVPVRAQTMVRVPVEARQGNADCAPGHYGRQWPGSVYQEATHGNSGWYAYAWCMDDGGLPVYIARLCATDECMSMQQLFGIVGQLIGSAIGADPRTIARDYTAAHPLAYLCVIYPPGGIPPALTPAKAALVPATDTPRGRACAELLALMQRDWPMLEFAAPPPTPPPGPPPPIITGTQYVTVNTLAYAFTAIPAPGKRAAASTAAVVKGASCDCSGSSMPFLQFGARYCYVAVTVPGPFVAACAAKP